MPPHRLCQVKGRARRLNRRMKPPDLRNVSSNWPRKGTGRFMSSPARPPKRPSSTSPSLLLLPRVRRRDDQFNWLSILRIPCSGNSRASRCPDGPPMRLNHLLLRRMGKLQPKCHLSRLFWRQRTLWSRGNPHLVQNELRSSWRRCKQFLVLGYINVVATFCLVLTLHYFRMMEARRFPWNIALAELAQSNSRPLLPIRHVRSFKRLLMLWLRRTWLPRLRQILSFRLLLRFERKPLLRPK